jgi:hypothetical protein
MKSEVPYCVDQLRQYNTILWPWNLNLNRNNISVRLGRCTESPYLSVQAVRCIFVDGLHYVCFHSERVCAWEKEREREHCKCVASELVFVFISLSFKKHFSLSVYHLGHIFIEAVCTLVVSAISRALTLAYRYMANERRLADPVIATVWKWIRTCTLRKVEELRA